MKKVSLLVLLCMILSLAFVFTSCSEDHEHDYGEAWVNDGENHYHACSGCSEKDGLEAHIDTNSDNACDVCAYPIKNLYSVHQHEYNTTWAFDASNHFYTCKTCGAAKDTAAHADEDGNNLCDVCGFVIVNLYHAHEFATGDSWTFDKNNHFHSCSKCNAVQDTAAHTDTNGDNACDVCGYVIENLYVEHQHDYKAAWDFNATQHYKNCKTCIAITEAADHADANGDNACDVCGYVMSNLYHSAHDFDENVWLFDLDSHYHRCNECTEIKDDAPHSDEDGNNLCDVCGCIVENLFVPTLPAGTIGPVIEDALDKDDLVTGGNILLLEGDGTFYNTTVVDFSFGENFANYTIDTEKPDLYGTITSHTDKTYHWVNDRIVAFETNDNSDVHNLTYQDEGWLYGYGFEKIYGTYGDYIYGVAKAIDDLYDKALASETIYEEIVEESGVTVYCFAFSHKTYNSVLDITVAFSLGEKGNIEAAYINTVNTYVEEDGTPTYGIASDVHTYTVEQTAEASTATPTYTLEKYFLTNFTLTDDEDNVYDNENGITLELGKSFKFNIADVTPETAILTENIYAQILNSVGDVVYDLSAETDTYAKTITVKTYSKVGNYNLAIYINGDDNTPVYLIPVTVNYLTPTSIAASVNGSAEAVTEVNAFTGIDVTIAGIAGEKQNPAVTAALTGANADDATLVGENGTYTFKSDVAGTYTVEVKSAVNAELDAVTLTITVEAPPTVEELLAASGEFFYDLGYGDSITLVFNATAGTMQCTYVWWEIPYVTNYTYSVADGVITLTVDGTGGEYYVDDLAFNNSFKLTANGYCNGSLSETGIVFDFVAADAPKFEDVIAQAGKFYYDAGQGDYVEFVFDTEAGTITSDYYYWNNHYTATYNYILDGNNLTATSTTELSGTYVTNISLNADFTISADLYTDNVKSGTATLAFVADSGSDGGEDTTATVITPSTNSENPQTIELVSDKYQMTLAAGASAYFVINDSNAMNYEILVECDTGLSAWVANRWTPTGTMEIVDPQYPTVGYIFWIQNDTEAEITATFTFTATSLE